MKSLSICFIAFQPVVSSEQTQKSGISMTVKTQNQCITIMDAYKKKSLEVQSLVN